MKRWTIGLLLAACVVASWTSQVSAQTTSDVRLVVCVVVDGLRPDSLHRALPRCSPDGFRRLFKEGFEYRQAHYGHSNTFTAVGHATLLTGTYSLHHGIVGNYWFDPITGERVYAVGDDNAPIIGETGRGGRSPANLLHSTVGDELVLATGGRSRVFSVSGKDRAAILPGGHLGQAYWYDRRTGRFVTSTYYRKVYPSWVETWNAASPADRYRDQSWTLLHKVKTSAHRKDDRSGERGYKYLGRTFPHVMAGGEAPEHYTVLRYTPYADELLLDFTQRLLVEEKIGQGDTPDLLCVSFSAMDYVQHAWGVHSLEAEDTLLRMDRMLAELLKSIDAAVGPGKSLVVLTADHGFDDIPEEAQQLGHSAGRHDPEQLVARANAVLRKRFKTPDDLVSAFWPPSMYLDLKAIERLPVDAAIVERALAEMLMREPGIAFAATRSDLLVGRLPQDPILRRVQNAFNPKRSGSVLVVQEPFWYLYTAPDVDASTHGSPYNYDTHVPLLFAGPGVVPGSTHRPVGIDAIAPTIAAYLHVASPSGSISPPLKEVVSRP